MANLKKKKKKRIKNCPSCKGTKVCSICNGCGTLKIVNGRAKGSTFERKIAKDLTDWCGFLLTRTPSSGGWNQTGDITPKDPKLMVKFPFNIECKNQKIFSTSALVQCSGGDINKVIGSWWKQCTDDATTARKVPLLVMTSVHEPVFVMMWQVTFKQFKLRKHCSFVIRTQAHTCNLRVMLWEEFLSVPYKKIIERRKLKILNA